MRWLKLNRDEVDDKGPSSLYEPARLRLIRGEVREERIMSECA
jgi:hypothetical protein